MNFSSNHRELSFLLTTALPGNILNSNHHIQNAGTSLVALTGLGICRNPGLECDAGTNHCENEHSASQSHQLRNAMTEQCSPGTRVQPKSWNEIPPASTSSSTQSHTWAIQPIPLFPTSTGHHTSATGWFSASSVCFYFEGADESNTATFFGILLSTFQQSTNEDRHCLV